MTYTDLVREYFPDASDDEAGYILWNETPYPSATQAQMRTALWRLQQQRQESSRDG